MNADNEDDHKRPEPQGSGGFFRGLVDAFREGMKEADESESHESGTSEPLLEEASWFQKSLTELLSDGERVIVTLEGLDISALVCTDRRIIIFHTGHFTWMLGKVRSLVVPYSDILGVSLTEERLRIQPLLGGGYVFEVTTQEFRGGATVSGSMFEFAAEPNRLAFAKEKYPLLENAVALIREKMAESERSTTPVRTEISDAPKSAIEKLQELTALRDSQMITEEEFLMHKAKILESL